MPIFAITMQALMQGTKRQIQALNIQLFSRKLSAPQHTSHDYYVKHGRTFSTSTTMTSTTFQAGLQSEGETSQTNQGSLPVKPFSAMPGTRGLYNIPYLGFGLNFKPFSKYSIGEIDKIFIQMHKRFGPIYRMQVNTPTVVVTDPKDILTVLENQGEFPVRPTSDLYEMYYKSIGLKPTMGAIQGKDWWELRRPMQKVALKPTNLSHHLPLMESVADDFVKMLLSGYLKNRNTDKVFMAYAAESTGTLFFNRRLGFLWENPTEESKLILQSIYDVFDVLYNVYFGSIGYKFYRSKNYIRFESAQNNIIRLVTDHVTRVKQDLEWIGTEKVKDSIAMSLLKDGVSQQDVVRILESLYSGSIDSSSAGIQSALYILAKHQDVQEKVRKDVFTVLCGTVNDSNISTSNHNKSISSSKEDGDFYNHIVRDIPRHISKGALNKMHYLTAFVKEVHRFSPLIPIGTVRVLPVDVALGGYRVPAGTQIYTSHIQASNDETIFENPHEFMPERWLREPRYANSSTHSPIDGQTTRYRVQGQIENSIDDVKRNFAVVPFGLGLRSCPGKRIFTHEITLLIAKLLTKMRIGLEPGCEEIKFKYRLFLKPEKSIPFTFTPLNEISEKK